jgi:hypothetical protein
MPQVNYNSRTVSDEDVKKVLENIAAALGKDVNVSSGDRDKVPGGGSKTSHHLDHRAADFHVAGETDQNAFASIKAKKDDIFASDKRFQCIRHGEHTETQGAHLHVGRYATGSGVSFVVEGLTADGTGKYTAG